MFRAFFVPLMHDIYQQALRMGQLSDDWAQALLNLIPKALGRVGVLISAISPVHQTGLIKG